MAKPENIYKILEILKHSYTYSYDNYCFKPNLSCYVPREYIVKESKFSKQLISKILNEHSELFETTTIKTPTEKEPLKVLQVYGLSEKGYNYKANYYDKNIFPKNRIKHATETKNKIDKFANPSKNKFIRIKDNELNDFGIVFRTAWIGLKEFPFEIKIKLKPKFKNKIDLYSLFMDKSLAEHK